MVLGGNQIIFEFSGYTSPLFSSMQLLCTPFLCKYATETMQTQQYFGALWQVGAGLLHSNTTGLGLEAYGTLVNKIL